MVKDQRSDAPGSLDYRLVASAVASCGVTNRVAQRRCGEAPLADARILPDHSRGTQPALSPRVSGVTFPR